MLRGDNGILNRSTEAKFANGIAQFDEQTKLVAMSVKTSIESNKVSKAGYIATKTENVETLAYEVAKGLGVTAQVAGTSGISISSEGYTVVYYVKTAGDETTNGEAYIGIWYTDNSLRSTMGNVDITRYGLTNTNNISPNEAVLVAYIHIENYNSEMSEKELTSLTTGITFAEESSSEQTGNNNNNNNNNTEVPDLLKDYVLGKEVNGVRPGKNINEIFNNGLFIDDLNSIEHASLKVDFLNILGNRVFIRYEDIAYKILGVDARTEIDTETGDTLIVTSGRTTDVLKVYVPKAESKEGKVVSYKANASDSEAKSWIVLYDNGDTLDITPIELDQSWSYRLGYGYGNGDPNANGSTEIEKAQDSYNNAVERLNNYCKTIVTNVTSTDNVRCVGTQFNQAETTEKYSSSFLANNPVGSAGTYNNVGLVGDMNAEQDIVRMSYYNVAYGNLIGGYWLASRFIDDLDNLTFFRCMVHYGILWLCILQ